VSLHSARVSATISQASSGSSTRRIRLLSLFRFVIFSVAPVMACFLRRYLSLSKSKNSARKVGETRQCYSSIRLQITFKNRCNVCAASGDWRGVEGVPRVVALCGAFRGAPHSTMWGISGHCPRLNRRITLHFELANEAAQLDTGTVWQPIVQDVRDPRVGRAPKFRQS
jgi:hypothetical protein